MAPTPIPEADEFVKKLPKVELHVHIEGTLNPSLRWRLAQRNNIKLKYPTEEALNASYLTMYNHRIQTQGDNGLPTFFEAYYGGMEVLRTEEDFFELGMEYFTKAASMNVRYAAPFFDPQAHTRRGVPLAVVMRGLQRAKTAARDELGVHSDWTMCFLRDTSPESALSHYEAAMPFREVFNAIGLDSDEYDRPPLLFEAVFRRARADGLKLTSHCDFDQKDTHEHIRQVASELGGHGADRIDHGLNAADRPELVALIKQKGIGMTLCPHAYHRRTPTEKVFPRIRTLFDAGIPITINSDDPTYMHQRWVEECIVLVQEFCHFTRSELVQLQQYAVDISWADVHVKERIRRELEAVRI